MDEFGSSLHTRASETDSCAVQQQGNQSQGRGYGEFKIDLTQFDLLIKKLPYVYDIKEYLIVPTYHGDIIISNPKSIILVSINEFFRDFPELIKYKYRYTKLIINKDVSIGYLDFNKIKARSYKNIWKNQGNYKGQEYINPIHCEALLLYDEKNQQEYKPITINFLRKLMNNVIEKRELEE